MLSGVVISELDVFDPQPLKDRQTDNVLSQVKHFIVLYHLTFLTMKEDGKQFCSNGAQAVYERFK